MKNRLKNNSVLIGMIFGGLYISIHWILSIVWEVYFGLGDPGSAYIFFIPLFWPVLFTYILLGGLLSALSISKIFLYAKNYEIVLSIINLFIWVLIGGLVGKIYQKRNKELLKK